MHLKINHHVNPSLTAVGACRSMLSLAGVVLLTFANSILLVDGQSPVQTYFVPLTEEALMEQNFKRIYRYARGPVNSMISIAIAADNTVIWYDHWEDGYEQDIVSLDHGTTEVWGDMDLSNGCPPSKGGQPNPCTDPMLHDVLNGGDAIVLSNDVPVPRDKSQIYYDGADRVEASFPISMTRGAYPRDPGPYMAGAVEVQNTNAWGMDYMSPVGFDVRSSTAAFEATAAFIMFSQDRTSVKLPDGSIHIMYAGENLVYERLRTGHRILADKPIQVNVLAGDRGSNFELRWYSIIPYTKWGTSYYTPVGTDNSAETRVWIYNPHQRPIYVSYEFLGAGGRSGTSRVRPDHWLLMPTIPNNSGARYYVDRVEDPFYGVTQTEANAVGVLGESVDWGHPLIPEDTLTSQALVGWGYGCTDQCANYGEYSGPRSKVFVTPITDATIHVDTNGDGTWDEIIEAQALESIKLTDPDDDDMTGALIVATTSADSTDPVKIAVAWGQDPESTGLGDPHGLDLGTFVPPLPILDAGKTVILANDPDENGLISPGDTVTYIIRVANVGQVDLPPGSFDVYENYYPLFKDATYVLGSTQYISKDTSGNVVSTESVPDDTSGTVFPLDDPGLPSRTVLLARGGTHEVTFNVQIPALEDLTPGTHSIDNIGTIKNAAGEDDPYGLVASETGDVDQFEISTPLYIPPPPDPPVQPCGTECVNMYAGEDDPTSEQTGQACVRNVGDELHITVTESKLGCTLYETHICNLPYVSEHALGSTEHTLSMSTDEASAFVCGYDDTDYMMAGHATLQCDDGTFIASYFEIALCCDEVVATGENNAITPPDSGCSTSFAFGKDQDIECVEKGAGVDGGSDPLVSGNCATCFEQISLDGLYPSFFQWGWTNGGLLPQPGTLVTLQLWERAVGCDFKADGAFQIGTVTINFPEVGQPITVDVDITEDVEIRQTNFYLGTEVLPRDLDGSFTITPGEYPVNDFEVPMGTTTYSTSLGTLTDPTTPLHFVGHSIVCEPGVPTATAPPATTAGPGGTASPNDSESVPWNGFGRPPTQSPTPAPTYICDYECPENSSKLSRATCPVDFNECECDRGYQVAADGESCEACPFSCGANMKPVDLDMCPGSMSDCRCSTISYRLAADGQSCELICDFDCGGYDSNSVARPGRGCIANFGHCDCVPPYEKSKSVCSVPT